MSRFIKYWIPVYVWGCFIYFLSSLPSPPGPPFEIPFLDKISHLIEYIILSYLLKRAFCASSNLKLNAHSQLLAMAIAILYGISDEFHQHFVPNRSVEGLDLLFDSIGAVLGSFIYKK